MRSGDRWFFTTLPHDRQYRGGLLRSFFIYFFYKLITRMHSYRRRMTSHLETQGDSWHV